MGGRMVTVGLLLFALCAVASARDANLGENWEEYKRVFNKKYDTDEAMYRAAWEENVRKIALHNLRADLKQVSFRLTVNEFADMTSEMLQKRMNLRAKARRQAEDGEHSLKKDDPIPDSIDWRQKGFNLPVEDQGPFGQTWGSALQVFDARYWLAKGGKLIQFSKQNLYDCIDNTPNLDWEIVYNYIKENGVNDVGSYPKPGCTKGCCFNPNGLVAYCNGTTYLPPQDEEKLKEAVATLGPIGVAIDASQTSFQLYSSGIYEDPQCSNDVLDHYLIVVGYGNENGKDFWLCKNSWGVYWGEQGYIKIARNKNNMCGIATQAVYPIV